MQSFIFAYQFIFILVLLIITYLIGTAIEKRHYASIIAREKKLNSIPAIAMKTPPAGHFQQQLVLGSVTISVDYFKRFLAALHNFFGGRVTSYETLLDRARREALLRMKEQAATQKATLVLNIKYETASISKGHGKSIGSVEVLAYGTAMIPTTNHNEKYDG